jgi:hypothetical protein
MLAIASFAIVACGDVTRSTQPTTNVAEDTLTVFPMRGSPLSAPTAIDLYSLRTLRIGDGSGLYDFAVDTAAGAALVYPLQLIENTTLPATGLLEVTSDFESILEAPTTGYQDTAAVSLTPGETVVVRARNACSGGFTGRDFFYAKVQLLELASSDGYRTLRLRVRTNANCGFRSFADGLPEF